MMFLDEAKITVRSGRGGDGCISFLREKFREFGGPNGGDGGAGGSIYALCADSLNTLADYRFQKHVYARNGRKGEGSQRTGAKGADVFMKLPRGTEVWAGGVLIADLTAVGQCELIARGGRGGLGNLHFRSSVNQAPRRALPGEAGSELEVELRLKLFADVGVIGLPNAGKSTFVSRSSAARPKVADYPFTTRRPALGMVEFFDSRFVIADIPGLIEGAHAGVGLGFLFLRHIERCRTVLHLIDLTASDPLLCYRTVRNELSEYSDSLLTKPEIVALNKSDASTPEQIADVSAQIAAERGTDDAIYVISAASGSGVRELLGVLAARLNASENTEATGDVAVDSFVTTSGGELDSGSTDYKP